MGRHREVLEMSLSMFNVIGHELSTSRVDGRRHAEDKGRSCDPSQEQDRTFSIKLI